jgi:hypothetical protein
LGEALLHSADHGGDDLPYEDLVEQAIAGIASAGPSLSANWRTACGRRQRRSRLSRATCCQRRQNTSPGRTIALVGEFLCQNKQGDDGHWTPKTAPQPRSIFDLLGRFMAEAPLPGVCGSSAGSFGGLRPLPASAARDLREKPTRRDQTIEEIEASAAALPTAERGPSIGTAGSRSPISGRLCTRADAALRTSST